MSNLEYLVTWLLKLRVRLSLLFQPQGHCGRIRRITPWRDVLVVEAERGVVAGFAPQRPNFKTKWPVLFRSLGFLHLTGG